MAQPTTQNINAGFDPTGYDEISGAALKQLLDLVTMAEDKGIIVATIDVAGVPTVPDADEHEEWQRFIWLRIGATSVGIYCWNPGGATDPTYLNWQPAFQAAIPAGSIQGYQIALNTITDANISTVSWSKIIGAPTTINSGSAAGGDLAGTYPDPTIDALAVTTGKIAINAVTGGAAGQLGTGANGATLANNIAVPAASTGGSPAGASVGVPLANDRVVVGVGATAYATVRKLIDALAEPVVGDANKIVAVNAAGNAFEYRSTGQVLQSVIKRMTATTSNVVIPLDNTLPQIGEGSEIITLNFAPISLTSLIRVRFGGFVAGEGDKAVILALFMGAGADAKQAVAAFPDDTSEPCYLALEHVVLSPGIALIAIAVRMGPSAASTCRINALASGAVFSTAAESFLIVEEIVGTLS